MKNTTEDTMDKERDVAISATNLTKRYGKKLAVDSISFDVPVGRILGVIGPNGSGKTTTLKALLGLIPFEGDMRVLGIDPREDRGTMMQNVCFIADVAVLPRWMSVKQALDFVEGVHPKFRREKAEKYLAKTTMKNEMKVREMSKGMVTQLHLALIMAIDASVLVLDEPTLGLDILYRKEFYKTLIEDYFDHQKTIVITTHQVEEVEHLLTDLLFIQHGKIVLQGSMEDLSQRFTEVMVSKETTEKARLLKPIDERSVFGKSIMVFDGQPIHLLEHLGETRPVSLSDLFVATMKEQYL